MKFLNVIDEQLASNLISCGYKLLKKQYDINNATVWTFSLDGFCFDINDVVVKGKCFICDRLTMAF